MLPIIRKAVTRVDREKVYRFRYDVYMREMGRTQVYADHEHERIEEPLDEHGIILAAFVGEEVVGTVRLNRARDGDLGWYPALYGMAEVAGELHPEHTSISTKLMVAREHRRTALAGRLALSLYQVALEAGVLVDFINCNAALVGYFVRLGYRRYRETVEHPEYGEVVPMVLSLRDEAHLRSVGSPFLRVLRADDPVGPREREPACGAGASMSWFGPHTPG
jgi:hypothetical protein